MRRAALLRNDIRFQWRHGFYLLYAVFTAAYLLTLAAVPEGVRRTVATVMIFTDPAAMGLFFMGAIVLLEKGQRVNCAVSVSPARVWEYVLAKLLSLAAIGLIVAIVLAVAGGMPRLPSCLVGVLLSSFLCSACGLIAAMVSRSLNHFMLLAVPFELLLCLPPALLLFGIAPPLLSLHPGVAAVLLIYGDAPNALICVLSLLFWCGIALWLCMRTVRKRFVEMGGAAT